MEANNLKSSLIDIEFAYYEGNRIKVLALQLPFGISLMDALRQQPEIPWVEGKIGIFGKIMPLDTVLQAGDRIEIYRDLVIDPKEARRARAKEKARALRAAWLAKKQTPRHLRKSGDPGN